MNCLRSLRFALLSVCLIGPFATGQSAVGGLVVYDNAHKADFLSNVQPGAFEITSLPPGQAYPNPVHIKSTTSNFGITVYSGSNYAIYVNPPSIRTFGTYDPLIINFDIPTTAFGGNFELVREGPTPQFDYAYVVVRTTHGLSQALYTNKTTPYAGFAATNGDTLSSVTVYPNGNLGEYAAILVPILVGQTALVPEPGTLAGAALAVGIAIVRCRMFKRGGSEVVEI